jgi:carboxyl-terminal processing protease
MSSNGEKIVLGIAFDVKEDKLFISSIEKNSAAETSGLKVGDRLISIKDKKVETYAEYVAFYINNSFTENEDVKVMVERHNEKLEFTIKPKKTTIQLSKSEVIDNILYIELSTFSEKSFTEINEIIKSIETKYDGIILDLRDNGGGSLESLEKIAGLFMKDKLIAEFRYKNETEKCYTKSGNAFTDLPLVILVNGDSASASECLTGALKCHERATIVGTQTFGKGIGQSTYQCPNGGYVTFTTSKYYLPNGECIHEVGITPDIVVELPKEIIDGDVELTKDNDTQLQKAIELLKK